MAQTLKEIEAEMDEIQMLMKIWMKFYTILTTSFYGTEEDIRRLDPEFQQIKQIVAEHHGNFMKVIKKDFHIGQSILTTVKRTISLDGFHDLSPLEINKTLIEWHDANILLNETLGSLECDRDFILRGRQKNKVPEKSAKDKVKEFFQSGTFKGIVWVVVLGIIVGAFYMYGETIAQTQFYKDYLKWMLDPVFNLMGIETAPEAANGGAGGAEAGNGG